MRQALNIIPVVRHSGLLNANLYSVAEQRQQLSAEFAAWGVTLLERSHAGGLLCWSVWGAVVWIVVPDREWVLVCGLGKNCCISQTSVVVVVFLLLCSTIKFLSTAFSLPKICCCFLFLHLGLE